MLPNQKKLTAEDVALYLNGLFLVETKDSLYAMCEIDKKMGVLFRVTKGLVTTIWFLDLKHGDTYGYKKSKDIPTDILPNATAAWYGFFNQKDIEVWIYATHEDAVEFGTAPADEATGRDWRKGGGEKGAGTKAMFSYGDYMVAGNLVILCELDVTNCEALVANMD